MIGRVGLKSDMDVRCMRTEELIPYERNQKKHNEKQIRDVANSIRRFGWQQPIVVDGKGVIIIGHCRWEAAKLLGAETVPVVCTDDLTEDEVRELRIVDNKTNESPWDFERLETDLAELDFDGFEFDLGDPFAEKQEANAIDLDDEQKQKDNDVNICHCPKCGFIFEVKK